MLTGSFEQNLPNTLKNVKGSSFVDEAYPMVWQDFAARLNYASLFGEDWPLIGTFQYRMKGFSKPPTLHYMRLINILFEMFQVILMIIIINVKCYFIANIDLFICQLKMYTENHHLVRMVSDTKTKPHSKN